MESEWLRDVWEFIRVYLEDKLFACIFSWIFVKNFPTSFAKGNVFVYVWIFIILKN